MRKDEVKNYIQKYIDSYEKEAIISKLKEAGADNKTISTAFQELSSNKKGENLSSNQSNEKSIGEIIIKIIVGIVAVGTIGFGIFILAIFIICSGF